ncbi:hypothetical protein GCM10009828_103050 [Actinoplanes couchii]
MAPVKPHVQAERVASARSVLRSVENPGMADVAALEDISVVKGLFNRSHRQDQWDWFTVWQQLGRPSRRAASAAANGLTSLRNGLRDREMAWVTNGVTTFRNSGGLGRLTGYLAGEQAEPDGVGYVYILSTREQPDVLKIGYTDRSVEERVKEINRATGVLVPYGARAVWAVPRAQTVEAEIHRLLAPYRIRKDREFFDIPFREAAPIIQAHIAESEQ